MPLELGNYLIDQAGINWSTVLKSWSWLVPSNFTVWIVNRFADLFLVFPDGGVHMMDIGRGTLAKIADSRDDFCDKIDTGDNANDWLLIPLVDRLVEAGIVLQAAQCYAFKTLPILGGTYDVDNFGPLSVEDYLGAFGSIHEQLQDLPDGTQVVLKVVD